MKLRELFVEMSVEADDDEVEAFNDSLDNLKNAMGRVVKGAAKMGAAVAAATGGLGVLAARESQLAEEFVRTSQAFDLGTDTYQELRFAFQSLNASSDDLHDTMGKLERRLVRANEGAAQYQRTFAALNIDVQEFLDMPMEERLMGFFDAARDASDSGEALGRLSQILGSDLARRLLPGINDTSGAMERYVAVAQDAGLIIEEELLDNALEAQFSFRLLGAAVSGVTRNIGVRLAPAFARLSDRITDAIVQVADYILILADSFTNFISGEFEHFSQMFEGLNTVVQTYLGGWTPIIKFLIGAFGTLVAVMSGKAIYAAIIAAKVALAKFAAVAGVAFAPAIAAILAIAAGLVWGALLIQDFIGWFTDAQTAVERLAEQSDSDMSSMVDAFYKVAGAVQSIWRVTATMFGAWMMQVRTMVATIQRIFQNLTPLFSLLVPIIVAVAGVVGILLGLIMNYFAMLTNLALLVIEAWSWAAKQVMRVVMPVLGAIGDAIGFMFDQLGRLASLASNIPGVDMGGSVEVTREEAEERAGTEEVDEAGRRGMEGGAASRVDRSRSESRYEENNNFEYEGPTYNIEGGSPEEIAQAVNKREEDRVKRLEDDYART